MAWVRWFDEIRVTDIASVGGKNASLGELRTALTPLGIRIPDSFATTADAYRTFMRAGDLERVVRESLARIDVTNLEALQAAGARLRSAVLAAPLPAALMQAVREGYQQLEQHYGANCDVAVRSSATAEDLPEASFAGQQETFLNVSQGCFNRGGAERLVKPSAGARITTDGGLMWATPARFAAGADAVRALEAKPTCGDLSASPAHDDL